MASRSSGGINFGDAHFRWSVPIKRAPQQGRARRDRPQPLAVGETLRPDHDGHRERRERMGQRDGVVGRGFGKGQVALHFLGEKPIWPRKEMKLASPPKGKMALDVSSRTSLASPKSGVISVRVVLCKAGPGGLTVSIQ